MSDSIKFSKMCFMNKLSEVTNKSNENHKITKEEDNFNHKGTVRNNFKSLDLGFSVL